MKRLWTAALWATLALPAWPALSAPALQVTDDRGARVAWDSPPQRIVSLLPSLTESVCELGQCHKLVAVDRYSNWPPQIAALPRVGGGLDPHIEAIVALRPDVVLLSHASRAIPRLEALGLKVVALEPKSHADVQRVLGKVATVAGLDAAAAQAVWRHIDAAVSAAAQSLPPGVRRTRVYFEVNPGPYAAGEASFIGETLARLGVRNIVPAALGPFPKLNPEYIVRANPDLIMVGQRSVAGMMQRPGWHSLPAMRGQHLCVFPADQSDILVRPGPRMAEGARLMARCLAEKAPGRPQPDQPPAGAATRSAAERGGNT